MRFIIPILLLILALAIINGCAGMKVYRDSQGRIERIETTGIFPGKRKIEDCEIDTKISILDINLLKKE